MIVDYGVGNIFSLRRSLEKAGFNVTVGSSPKQLRDADLIVLPGVGNFTAASEKLTPLKEEIHTQVLDGTFIFGICLGLQLLFGESEEGEGEGLAVLEGKNIRLPNFVKTPHMGWNTLRILKDNRLLEGIRDESYLYFAHSCYPVPKRQEIVISETTYGVTFPSAVEWRNIYGTQFHPEKSGKSGLGILRNLHKIAGR
jgi:glutamine amidotransferase